ATTRGGRKRGALGGTGVCRAGGGRRGERDVLLRQRRAGSRALRRADQPREPKLADVSARHGRRAGRAGADVRGRAHGAHPGGCVHEAGDAALTASCAPARLQYNERMDFEQLPHLETFIQAAETSSLTAAAMALGLPQAAVNQRISALEKVLGKSV